MFTQLKTFLQLTPSSRYERVIEADVHQIVDGNFQRLIEAELHCERSIGKLRALPIEVSTYSQIMSISFDVNQNIGIVGFGEIYTCESLIEVDEELPEIVRPGEGCILQIVIKFFRSFRRIVQLHLHFSR